MESGGFSKVLKAFMIRKACYYYCSVTVQAGACKHKILHEIWINEMIILTKIHTITIRATTANLNNKLKHFRSWTNCFFTSCSWSVYLFNDLILPLASPGLVSIHSWRWSCLLPTAQSGSSSPLCGGPWECCWGLGTEPISLLLPANKHCQRNCKLARRSNTGTPKQNNVKVGIHHQTFLAVQFRFFTTYTFVFVQKVPTKRWKFEAIPIGVVILSMLCKTMGNASLRFDQPILTVWRSSLWF